MYIRELKSNSMADKKVLDYIDTVLANMPADWLKLTTHRLDIYNEERAKSEFLEEFEKLYTQNNAETTVLSELPTAFDYIRLGHPLSCVLEWAAARMNNLNPQNVISFSSKTMPLLAVLRKNLFEHKNTRILYSGDLPDTLDFETLERVYGYTFTLKKHLNNETVTPFNGSTVFMTFQDKPQPVKSDPNIDFFIGIHDSLGSIIYVNGEKNKDYIAEIQHVRRRESIAMTPADCHTALRLLLGKTVEGSDQNKAEKNMKNVINAIRTITATESNALIGSSGLSVQYGIMMGLTDHAGKQHSGKKVKFIVPPNCYGGTNDQARRVAACLKNVEVLDLPVDGENDMVQSVDRILNEVAKADAVPYIIAEIPTNPRVEVPNLDKLKEALSKVRTTESGQKAIAPVFILDQTFCPNVQFLSKSGILSSIKTISYVSGSKFPSGGKCTAGYCAANEKAEHLMPFIDKHLALCDNRATDLQTEILATQMPGMNQRIEDAYQNTREFVNFIRQTLPEAKINFVSEELARDGFTPSVFSLDLPTKGHTNEERETYKRALNNKLINMMIEQIPGESKYCVSYGQLKGCYWTIPATSTQGTTKEADKDYIARVSVSPDLDLEKHKEVFKQFTAEI